MNNPVNIRSETTQPIKVIPRPKTRWSLVFTFYAFLFIGLYWISQMNYLLFHSLAEIFGVVVAASTFIMAWNTRRYTDADYLISVGIGMLFVGILDILHTLTYQGMGVFPANNPDLATQLWLAARYTQTASFLFASFYFSRRLNTRNVLFGYAIATSLMVGAIMILDIFPTAFVEGQGITPFKFWSEIAISLGLVLAAGLLLYNRHKFAESVVQLLVLALLTGVASELLFTGYDRVTDIVNAAGHFLKIISFYLIYKAIIESGLQRPFSLLFHNLTHSENALRKAHDELEKRVAERTMEVMQANLALQNEVKDHLRTEEELRSIREHLEDMVAARTLELEWEVSERERAEAEVTRYASRLERSNHELQEFAYVASHDLQEPLRKITAFGERLVHRLDVQLPEEEADLLRRMISAAERMQNMIDGLLAYSRVSTRPAPIVAVDLHQLVNEALADLDLRMDESGGRVELGPLPTIEADPRQMLQLFQNLVSNGLKFHEPGVAPLVTVSETPASESEAPEGMVEIKVSDNGIGFDQVYLDRLFQPFQRLVGRSQYEGSGIGLAICRKIVERHGGSITARSAPHQGAEFIIHLPVRQSQELGGVLPVSSNEKGASKSGAAQY